VELYVFYDKAADAGCQPESSKKFHKYSGTASDTLQCGCDYFKRFQKNPHLLQECFVFTAERWYTEFCALVRAVRFVHMGFRRGGSRERGPCIQEDDKNGVWDRSQSFLLQKL
jgi:hypothetical protein